MIPSAALMPESYICPAHVLPKVSDSVFTFWLRLLIDLIVAGVAVASAVANAPPVSSPACAICCRTSWDRPSARSLFMSLPNFLIASALAFRDARNPPAWSALTVFPSSSVVSCASWMPAIEPPPDTLEDSCAA
jgi:hypothetical protein